ncbi:MAG: hypothetical protein IPK81_17290 [Rhodospirillales bacterium]|nr:MAG: hypothetical protein IPK81_17290 [Rhodospirillales bacterium]
MGVFDEFEQDAELANVNDDAAAADRANGVKQAPNAGAKYEVNIGGPVLTWITRHINKDGVDWRGLRVDSRTVIDYYKNKWKNPKPGRVGRQMGMATAGLTMEREDLKDWARNGLIWVLSQEGRLYSHIPKIDRFHHSSFTSGAAVKSAGMWIVDNGVVREITPLSGHYRPSLGQFMNGVVALKRAVRAGRPRLMLSSNNDGGRMMPLDYNRWTSMSWKELFDSYKSHPHEVRPQPDRNQAGAAAGRYQGGVADGGGMFYAQYGAAPGYGAAQNYRAAPVNSAPPAYRVPPIYMDRSTIYSVAPGHGPVQYSTAPILANL